MAWDERIVFPSSGQAIWLGEHGHGWSDCPRFHGIGGGGVLNASGAPIMGVGTSDLKLKNQAFGARLASEFPQVTLSEHTALLTR
jgi:hypothetical protein